MAQAIARTAAARIVAVIPDPLPFSRSIYNHARPGGSIVRHDPGRSVVSPPHPHRPGSHASGHREPPVRRRRYLPHLS